MSRRRIVTQSTDASSMPADSLADLRTGKKNKKNKSVLKQMKKAKKKAKKQARKAAEAVEDAVEDVVDAAEDVAKDVVAAAERTMEELQDMAKRAFKKILEAAANAMVAAAQDVGTWARDDLKIPVPGQEQFDAAAELVGGVPFVGGSMASAMTEKVEEVARAFMDAIIAVATDPGCIQAFLDPILSIDLDDAMALCEKGLDGPALAEFFEDTCGAAVKETMTGVEAMEGGDGGYFSSRARLITLRERCRASTRFFDLPTRLDNFVEGCKRSPLREGVRRQGGGQGLGRRRPDGALRRLPRPGLVGLGERRRRRRDGRRRGRDEGAP